MFFTFKMSQSLASVLKYKPPLFEVLRLCYSLRAPLVAEGQAPLWGACSLPTLALRISLSTTGSRPVGLQHFSCSGPVQNHQEQPLCPPSTAGQASPDGGTLSWGTLSAGSPKRCPCPDTPGKRKAFMATLGSAQPVPDCDQ